MSFTATVTAKSGPAIQSTAIPITGVTAFAVDADRKVLQLFHGSPGGAPDEEFELSGNTFTVTIAAGAITALTVS